MAAVHTHRCATNVALSLGSERNRVGSCPGSDQSKLFRLGGGLARLHLSRLVQRWRLMHANSLGRSLSGQLDSERASARLDHRQAVQPRRRSADPPRNHARCTPPSAASVCTSAHSQRASAGRAAMATERTSKDMLQEVPPPYPVWLDISSSETSPRGAGQHTSHPLCVQLCPAVVSEQDGAAAARDAEDTRRLRSTGALLALRIARSQDGVHNSAHRQQLPSSNADGSRPGGGERQFAANAADPRRHTPRRVWHNGPFPT